MIAFFNGLLVDKDKLARRQQHLAEIGESPFASLRIVPVKSLLRLDKLQGES